MKKFLSLLCLVMLLLCGCSPNSDVANSSYAISPDPYYMEDVHSITVDQVAIIVSDMKIVTEGAKGNSEDGPVLMVYYNVINYTDEPIDAFKFRVQHLEILSNYVSGGDIMYLFPAAAHDPVFHDDITLDPDGVGMYADAFEITDDLETVTLRFIADDAANPLGVETYSLSEITEEGTDMD